MVTEGSLGEMDHLDANAWSLENITNQTTASSVYHKDSFIISVLIIQPTTIVLILPLEFSLKKALVAKKMPLVETSSAFEMMVPHIIL